MYCYLKIVLDFLALCALYSALMRDSGPYHIPGARRSASVFASFSLTQFSFSHHAPRCLNSKCICAHLCAHRCAGLKKSSGALLARCYFEELKIDCAIDQLKPGLKSKVNGAIFFFVI